MVAYAQMAKQALRSRIFVLEGTMNPDERAELREQVEGVLHSVEDPCSSFIGSHLNLMELGMISELNITGSGDVRLTLLLDDPMCIYAPVIHHDVLRAISGVSGVATVSISIRSDEIWTEERMSSQGANKKVAKWKAAKEARIITMERVSRRNVTKCL